MSARHSLLKNWKVWFGIVVSIGAMYLAFRGEDFGAIFEAMKRVRWWVLLLLIPLIWGGQAIRAFRWRYLIHDDRSTFRERYNAVAIGSLVTNLLPLRLGELVRMYVFARRSRRSKAEIFATIAVERLFDILSIVLLFALVLPFLPFERVTNADSSEVGQRFVSLFMRFSRTEMVGGSIVLIALAIVGFMILCRYGRRLMQVVLDRFGIRRGRRVTQILGSLFDGLEALGRDHGTLPIVLMLSFGMWSFMGLIYYCALAAFPSGEGTLAGLMGLSGAIFLQTVICAGVAAPSAPGFLGVWQLAAHLAFFPWPEADPAAVGAFAIIVFLASYLVTIGYGFEAFVNEGVRWSELREVETSDEAVDSPDS